MNVLRCAILCFCALQAGVSHATDVTARLVVKQTGQHASGKLPPAVIWLDPLKPGTPVPAPGKFTLLQKNKTFIPHLLVVPVGSSVEFPNADPFFHNVFSLFDGRRFDLGLYEAGSTRSVVFSRAGVSYIFCNIHSDMSAVVISLATPYYAISDKSGEFQLHGVPQGDYELHVWVEGEGVNSLDKLTRLVHVNAATVNLGDINAAFSVGTGHLNKFGRPYESNSRPTY